MADENKKMPSADELLFAASALARHLSDAGVQFLPQANEDQVEQLASQISTESQSPTSAEGTAATQDASDPQATPGPDVAAADATPSATTPQARTARSNARPGDASVTKQPVAAPMPAGKAYSLPVMTTDQRTETLATAQGLVATCTRCPQLAQSRTNTVFGEGSPTARIAFFGEGPGADEDRSGRPFVGRAGQLLTKMIEACTFAREDVYILNTVKCRPPGNRNPEPSELSNCREFFEQQLAVIQPEYIVCLGAVSAQTLLQTTESVGRLRGRWHPYFASKVLVTYHPAYLLRNPAAKKAAWDDLKMMLADMGIQP